MVLEISAMNKKQFSLLYTEMERSSGWLPWSSLKTLNASFNVPSDNQGSHPDDVSVSVHSHQKFV